MKKVKLFGLLFFILSYLGVATVFLFENKLEDTEFPYWIPLWILGIVNVIFNIIYGANTKLKKLVFISMIISSTVWLFIPLMYSILGAIFLIIYFLNVIYIHTQSVKV